jgi:hypothetical protein
MTLTDFLLARYAEDEAVARAFTGPRWIMADDMPDAWAGLVDHVMRHRPARVLAECEALRTCISILTAWEPDPTPDERVETPEHDAWRILRALASVYADHPNFDARWAL